MTQAQTPNRDLTTQNPPSRGGGWYGPFARWGGPILITLVFLLMMLTTWLSWPDPVIDFGRELYIPWRITQGQVLYRDIAYHNGPLSPYVNALWFGFSGVSLMSLVKLNLFITVIVLWLLYRMLNEVAGRGAATLGCVTFIILFAFGQFSGLAVGPNTLVPMGNYNWVCPYSHEMTHGIALSLAAIYLARLFAENAELRYALASGLALGLVFLTKAEVFLAGACATALVMGLAVWRGAPPSRRAWRSLGVWAAAAVAPAVVSTVLLSRAMPLQEAITGTLGSWAYVFDSANVSDKFFRTNAGLNDAGDNALTMVAMLIAWFLAIAPALLASWLAPKSKPGRWALTAGAGVLYFLGFLAIYRHFRWEYWLRPAPAVLLVIFVAMLIKFLRGRPQRRQLGGAILGLGLVCFGGLMLLKMVLHAQAGHYGFGLAMVGTVMLCVALVDWAPGLIDRRGGYGPVLAISAAVLWIGVLGFHRMIIADNQRIQQFKVGQEKDAFRTDPVRGQILNDAVKAIQELTKPDQTLVTLVDCEMLNYLARRPNPTPYLKFIPHHVRIFGEQNMIESLQEHPPDLVALVDKDTGEYGARYFGKDYGRDLWQWVAAHYQKVQLFGEEPMTGKGFGVLLLRRVDAPASGAH